MAVLLTQRPKKATYQRGVVVCRKCAAPIYIHKLNALAGEFSVRCTKCSDRGMYSKREMNIESMPERRKKPRRARD
jgi:hypothetical protein